MQKVKIQVRDSGREFTDLLAMLDSDSNTSLLSKGAVKQLGISGPQTHLMMNLAGGQNKGEVSEMINIDIVSPTDEGMGRHLH